MFGKSKAEKKLEGIKFNQDLQRKILWANKDAFLGGLFEKGLFDKNLPWLPPSGQIPGAKP